MIGQQNGSGSPKLKVVILEDSKFALAGMLASLEAQTDIEVVGATAVPEEAIALVEAHHPQVAIIDLRIRKRFDLGFGVLRAISERFADVNCIVVTAFSELRHLVSSLEAGAKAFLSKDADWDLQPSLPDLVRKIAAGGTYYDPAMTEQMLPYVSGQQPLVPDRGVSRVASPLTPREREVLTLIVAQHSNKEIATELHITVNTVKAHVSSVLEKLHAKDRHEARWLALTNRANAGTTTEED